MEIVTEHLGIDIQDEYVLPPPESIKKADTPPFANDDGVRCPYCGLINPYNIKFCRRCGRDLPRARK